MNTFWARYKYIIYGMFFPKILQVEFQSIFVGTCVVVAVKCKRDEEQ